MGVRKQCINLIIYTVFSFVRLFLATFKYTYNSYSCSYRLAERRHNKQNLEYCIKTFHKRFYNIMTLHILITIPTFLENKPGPYSASHEIYHRVVNILSRRSLHWICGNLMCCTIRHKQSYGPHNDVTLWISDSCQMSSFIVPMVTKLPSIFPNLRHGGKSAKSSNSF